MARKTKVALLFGGRSAEHEISLISASSIYKNLDEKKYDSSCIYINKQGFWRTVESPSLLRPELDKGPFSSFLPWGNESSLSPVEADIYFPVLHGPYGEDGTIQGLFEMADVPYVGASVLASAAGMDKAISKSLFQDKKLPVVKHLAISELFWNERPSEILNQVREEFSLPFFVKPANMGSSVGITKVTNLDQVESAFLTAFRYDAKILIEQGITGREIECSVLGDAHPEASLPGEIIPHRDFYDYKDKYIDGKTTFKIPAELPSSITERIRQIAIAAFRAIDCSGMARVDFFLQKGTEKIFLNEINTIPGFTEISMYPKLWEVSGLSFSELLDRLITLGLERHKHKKRTGVLFKP
jgi:D-alanine-D-alanine ligase